MLIGRAAETAAIDRLLAGAREGRSGVLVIRGDAGVGKSALLAHALEQAGEMTVLRGLGVESESELAFAALHQILRPLLRDIERLPEPQAAALAAAFGLSSEPVDDRFRISLAVLGLLAEAAEARPVACFVDDAQWLDQASADALMFAARRFEADRIALLFAVRDDPARPFVAQGVADIRIDPLGTADARSLVDARLGLTPHPSSSNGFSRARRAIRSRSSSCPPRSRRRSSPVARRSAARCLRRPPSSSRTSSV